MPIVRLYADRRKKRQCGDNETKMRYTALPVPVTFNVAGIVRLHGRSGKPCLPKKFAKTLKGKEEKEVANCPRLLYDRDNYKPGERLCRKDFENPSGYSTIGRGLFHEKQKADRGGDRYRICPDLWIRLPARVPGQATGRRYYLTRTGVRRKTRPPGGDQR